MQADVPQGIWAVNDESRAVLVDLKAIGHLTPHSSEAATAILSSFLATVKFSDFMRIEDQLEVSIVGSMVPASGSTPAEAMTCAQVAGCGGFVSISVTRKGSPHPLIKTLARKGFLHDLVCGRNQNSLANTTLKADNTTLKADNAALKTRVDAIEADNTTLKADNTALKTRVDAIKADNTTLKADIATLKTAMASLAAVLNKWE
ncbi:uncharacterized protein ACA1_066420 [Acanthamoeba castellanii str. Neff]|uniref:Uncharacterized protein n=1 Tax=Acanthamoeba castellanii (strain ATCC 30010 / Neff) TaxID=1257118 RepID=L8GP19_ACACF|nr:uncharacterized protein ACA1_066420 [Acanthamoeba castellanii str. Neff]ELR14622.1 hypothetical protein ACA1_066420 [Acanthamoeba castellanii str. Neff]